MGWTWKVFRAWQRRKPKEGDGSMSCQDKELQEGAESNSADFRASGESIFGTTGAEFCCHSDLTQAKTTGLSAGTKLTELTRNLIYFYYWWWFWGHRGKRIVCLGFVWVFLNLVHFIFICLNENWLSLNYSTIRLIQMAEFKTFLSFLGNTLEEIFKQIYLKALTNQKYHHRHLICSIQICFKTPLFCSPETPPVVVCPVQGHPVEGHGPVGEGPEEGHEDEKSWSTSPVKTGWESWSCAASRREDSGEMLLWPFNT